MIDCACRGCGAVAFRVRVSGIGVDALQELEVVCAWCGFAVTFRVGDGEMCTEPEDRQFDRREPQEVAG